MLTNERALAIALKLPLATKVTIAYLCAVEKGGVSVAALNDMCISIVHQTANSGNSAFITSCLESHELKKPGIIKRALLKMVCPYCYQLPERHTSSGGCLFSPHTWFNMSLAIKNVVEISPHFGG